MNKHYRTLISMMWVVISLGGPTLALAQEGADEKLSRPLTPELRELIKELIDARLKELRLLDQQFDQRIEEGIVSFIEKRQQEQQQAQANAADQGAKLARAVSTDIDHVYGNPEAPISLIEYSDFECPFCKRFHPTARQLVDENAEQVNWVYRHFPLALHNPGAQKQAEASECANELGGNDAFWSYTDLIYARTTSNGRGFPIAKLVPLAEEIDLDASEFKECLDSGRYTARVQEDIDDGQRAGVTGTPGNILRNNRTGQSISIAGAQPYARLAQALESLLTDSAQD